jgi:hypothetical protein
MRGFCEFDESEYARKGLQKHKSNTKVVINNVVALAQLLK